MWTVESPSQLVECLALMGEVDRARSLFEQVTGRSNDVGLFAEQIDPDTGEQTGNFPQAFSHVGLINAAWRLALVSEGWRAEHRRLASGLRD